MKMEQIRKEIHTAIYSVSRLCDQFFTNYPQYYQPQTHSYQPISYSNHQNLPLNYNIHDNHWQSNSQDKPISSQIRFQQSKKIENKFDDRENLPKKIAKDNKKYEKKLESLRIQRAKEQKLKLKQQIRKKRQRKTLKNQIKKDPRLAQKPKFPMSPYFLFLQQMRQKHKSMGNSAVSNKQFAQEMGKVWREMPEQNKKPYVTNYVKQKKIYNEKMNRFYDKYPDLKPKNLEREKPKYPVDDPKYQGETENDENAENDHEIQTDLVRQLRSEESFDEQKNQGNKQTEFLYCHGDNEDNEFDFNQKESKNLDGQERQDEDYQQGQKQCDVVEID